MVTRSIRYIYRESGLSSVYATGRDAWLIILSRSFRMVAYGASSLILALFFAELGVPDERIGLFMTLTLVGDVVLSLLLTFSADHWGRRRTLLLGSLLMIVSGLVFSFFENYWILLLAAIVGVISATGSDFGPFRAVEESMLSELTDPTTRADVLVWYITTSVLGSAVGTEIAGHVIQYLHDGPRGWPLLRVYHFCFLAYMGTGVLNLLFSLFLSSKCELARPQASGAGAGAGGGDGADIALTPQRKRFRETGQARSEGSEGSESPSSSSSLSVGLPAKGQASESEVAAASDDGIYDDSDGDSDDSHDAGHGRPGATPSPSLASRFSQISRKTRRTMYGLWFLLMVDSLADGMASMSLTTYYVNNKFPSLGKDTLGNFLSAGYLLAAGSSVFAGPLSRYIGLVNTMVFTHVPSSAAVLLFPWPSSVWLTFVLLLIRLGFNNLDQAPRAALIAAVVRPEERTAVMGITSMLRTLASTTGPSVTGLLAGSHRFWIAFVVAGALRLCYDLGLFAMFVNIQLYQYEAVATSTDGPEGPDDNRMSDVIGHPESFVLDEEESVEGN